MLYTGYAWVDTSRRGYGAVSTPQIGLAWSDDLLNWEKDARSPILSPDPSLPTERAGVTAPFLWVENGRYHLFYFGTTEPGYERGLKCLHTAVSETLFDWTRHGTVIRPEGEGWRREAIWHPNVVKHEDQYYLFFNASGVHDGVDEEFIGVAVSNDLLTWDVLDEHCPILTGSRLPGRWDATGRAGDPCVFKQGNRWWMAYYSWDGLRSRDGYAWTTEADFPFAWRPYAGNPVLDVGPPGSFDALHAGKPFIYRADMHYHFYTAVDERESREIALAIAAI
jgi:predicted GH43/DUF377 family glycosyl hydrolase